MQLEKMLFFLLAIITDASPPVHWGNPRFAGKSIVVTGGDSGIGLATVKAFRWECGNVMMVGHNVQKTMKAYDDILAEGTPDCGADKDPKFAWLALDTRNITQVENMLNETVKAFGSLDIAINNAGVFLNESQIGAPDFLNTLPKTDAMPVNYYGTVYCMHVELKYWLDNKIPGVMVNVASICGETGFCSPTYTSSKWAIIGVSKQAALQYAPNGIRVNVLAPGAVNTTMLRNGLAPDDPRWIAIRTELEKKIPNGRIAEPWEMAGPITFLASDMSSYITGTVITADGALTLNLAN